MRQFTVPQFIDVEDKIIGPITTRQFLILLVCAIWIGICYKLFTFGLFLFIAVLSFAIFGTIAFVRVNGRPFHYFILNIIQTLKKPNLRIWNHKKTLAFQQEDNIKHVKKNIMAPKKRRFSTSRLAELSLVVDTAGMYKEQNKSKIQREKVNG